MIEHYDIAIIGSGAGGGTMAQALSGTGARILLIERGDFVPQEDENWDPTAVWKDLRYQSKERWLDERGREFRPYTHYNVGGNTKFWGSVLYRLRREDFALSSTATACRPPGRSTTTRLAPYYDRAERLVSRDGQHGLDPTEPERGPYPTGGRARPGHRRDCRAVPRRASIHHRCRSVSCARRSDGCILCNTCNSFVCRIHAKRRGRHLPVGRRPPAQRNALDQCLAAG